MQALADPAVDAVGEGSERDAVTGAESIAEGVELAWIHMGQRVQQRRGSLVQLQSAAAKQVYGTGDTALGGLCDLA